MKKLMKYSLLKKMAHMLHKKKKQTLMKNFNDSNKIC